MQQKKDSNQTKKKSTSPQTGDVVKQAQRQKAEQQEVAGRHKNDGQKDHKGSRSR